MLLGKSDVEQRWLLVNETIRNRSPQSAGSLCNDSTNLEGGSKSVVLHCASYGSLAERRALTLTLSYMNSYARRNGGVMGMRSSLVRSKLCDLLQRWRSGGRRGPGTLESILRQDAEQNVTPEVQTPYSGLVEDYSNNKEVSW